MFSLGNCVCIPVMEKFIPRAVTSILYLPCTVLQKENTGIMQVIRLSPGETRSSYVHAVTVSDKCETLFTSGHLYLLVQHNR